MRQSPAPPPLEARGAVPLLALLGFGVFLNVYTTQALLPELSGVFRASSVAVAATVSATTLAMALSAPVVGLLADASGRKRILVGALLLLCVPCLMIATAGTLADVILWRFVQGVLIPGVAVVATAYAAEELPPLRVPTALAAYITGTVVGGFGGRFISGLVTDLAGWREAFVVVALLNVAVALAVWAWLPRARQFVPQRASQGLQVLREHARNRGLLAACAVGFTLLFALIGVFTYVNFRLAAPPYHLSTAALGSVFAVYLLGVVVTPPSGRFVARHGHRSVLLAGLAMAALGFSLTLLSPLALIVVGLAVGSSGVFIAQATTTGYVATTVRRGRSLASGLYNLAYYGGGASGAVLVGYAYTHAGWGGTIAAVLGSLALAALLGGLLWRAPADS